MIEHATVTAPEMIGLLVWWIVVLAVPVIAGLRWRRRRKAPRARSRRNERSSPLATPHVAAIGRSGLPTTDRSCDPSDSSRALVEREKGADGSALDGRVVTASALGASGCDRSHAPGSQVPRLPPGTLEPLCRYVDFQHRLELAASELSRRLAQLPDDRWRVEQYPLTGERRNTLLVLGRTGVFVISATYSPGGWDDVVTVSRLGAKIQTLLPGYCGRVHSAICHPFSRVTPRVWHRADDRGEWIGAWLIGGDSVIEWLQHCGAEHGFGPGDLARFDALSKPNWLKPAMPAVPSWPPLPERGATDPSG